MSQSASSKSTTISHHSRKMNRCTTTPPPTENFIASPPPSTGSAVSNLYRCLQDATDRIVQQSVEHSTPSLAPLQLSHSHQSEAPLLFQSSPILLQDKLSEESFPLRDQPLSLETTAKESLRSWSLRLKSSNSFWDAYLEQSFGNKNYWNLNGQHPSRNRALTQLSNHSFRKWTNFLSFNRRSLL